MASAIHSLEAASSGLAAPGARAGSTFGTRTTGLGHGGTGDAPFAAPSTSSGAAATRSQRGPTAMHQEYRNRRPRGLREDAGMSWPPQLDDGVVILRPLTVDDASRHKAGEDEAQVHWFEFPGAAPMENVVAAIRSWEDAWSSGGAVRNFGIWDRATGELIGNTEAQDLGDGRVNISYVVFPRWRRRGVARRAVRLVTGYAAAHMGARTAEFKILPDNEASLAVARGTGARCMGLTRGDSGSEYLLFRLPLEPAPLSAADQPE